MIETIHEQSIDEFGNLIERQYKVGKRLGKGGFASCYEIQEMKTKELFAAKVIEKSTLVKEKRKQKLLSEINIQKSMNHPYIVHFKHDFEDDKRVYILLELCPNQTLKELLRRRKQLHELEAQFYIGQLISGLRFIHKENVIHRDLKLGNLFLGKNLELKIGDFGLAAKLVYPQERRKTVCGTPNYIAPEVLNSKICGHSFEADIWSVGVILYTLLVGKPPFDSSHVSHTYKRIKCNDYSFPNEINLSTEAKDLISSIFKVNPSLRPTLNEIMDHPFMNKYEFPKYLPMSTLSLPLSKEFIENSIKSNNCQHMLRKIDDSTENRKPIVDEGLGMQIPMKTLYELKERKIGTSGSTRISLQTINQPLPIVNTLMETQKTFGSKRVSNYSKILSGTVINQRGTKQDTQYKSNHKKLDKEDNNHDNIIYVMNYKDYSEKYGIAYVLTNGIIGFHYNDMTNMVWLKNKEKYLYSDFCNKYGKPEARYLSPIEYNGRDIEKKIKLISHFRKHCTKILDEVELSDSEEVGVQKVITLKKGMLFRLTNNVIQMIFIDQSEVIISFEKNIITYIDKNGKDETIKLINGIPAGKNERIIKRYKYTIGIINYLKLNKEFI